MGLVDEWPAILCGVDVLGFLDLLALRATCIRMLMSTSVGGAIGRAAAKVPRKVEGVFLRLDPDAADARPLPPDRWIRELTARPALRDVIANGGAAIRWVRGKFDDAPEVALRGLGWKVGALCFCRHPRPATPLASCCGGVRYPPHVRWWLAWWSPEARAQRDAADAAKRAADAADDEAADRAAASLPNWRRYQRMTPAQRGCARSTGGAAAARWAARLKRLREAPPNADAVVSDDCPRILLERDVSAASDSGDDYAPGGDDPHGAAEEWRDALRRARHISPRHRRYRAALADRRRARGASRALTNALELAHARGEFPFARAGESAEQAPWS